MGLGLLHMNTLIYNINAVLYIYILLRLSMQLTTAISKDCDYSGLHRLCREIRSRINISCSTFYNSILANIELRKCISYILEHH